MLRIAGYPLIFLAMFSIAGGHWAVLQSVAWTGMIIEYSRNASLGTALSQTFSGKAPCRMCRTIEEGRQKETRLPATIKADKKAEGFLAVQSPSQLLPPSRKFSYPPIPDASASMRPSSPLDPVPIAV